MIRRREYEEEENIGNQIVFECHDGFDKRPPLRKGAEKVEN